MNCSRLIQSPDPHTIFVLLEHLILFWLSRLINTHKNVHTYKQYINNTILRESATRMVWTWYYFHVFFVVSFCLFLVYLLVCACWVCLIFVKAVSLGFNLFTVYLYKQNKTKLREITTLSFWFKCDPDFVFVPPQLPTLNLKQAQLEVDPIPHMDYRLHCTSS